MNIDERKQMTSNTIQNVILENREKRISNGAERNRRLKQVYEACKKIYRDYRVKS